ncbi:MAG: Dabb family protein [Chitinophagaceae bacterium]
MKKICLLLLSFFLITNVMHAQTKNVSGKLLRHVVMFKFKDGTTAADIKKVEDAFRSLPTKIKTIKGFEWGTNNSPENLNQGFTHCFFLSFASAKDRDDYLPNPDHKAFGAVLGPYLDKVLVLDYWAEK